MNDLRYLIENECFITCPLLNTADFIKFCKDRDVDTSQNRLEHYEKLKIFYPLLRVQYPKIKYKVKYSDNRLKYTDFGMLGDDEDWSGDIIEQYAQMSFKRDLLLNWHENDFIWDPSNKPFKDWLEFKDENKRNKIDSFYSIFQIYELNLIQNLTTLKVNLESYVNNEQKYLNNIDKHLAIQKDILNKLANGNKCKLISFAQ